MELLQIDVIYISFAIFLAATAYQYMRPKGGRNYTSVNTAEAFDLVKKDDNLTIIDVRKRDEYRTGHLRKAKHVPINELDNRMNKLPTNKNLLVYCQTGSRSIRAIRRLEVAGYDNLYHMHEGYRGWKKAGHPTTER